MALWTENKTQGDIKMKVLIVDDDSVLLEAVKDMLVDSGYEVDCSNSAREAVGMVESVKYDYILVDYRMPKDDGIWFMENAKISPSTKVLLMTAYLNRDVINKMFSLGASGYIVKPFDEEELITHLQFHSK